MGGGAGYALRFDMLARYEGEFDDLTHINTGLFYPTQAHVGWKADDARSVTEESMHSERTGTYITYG